MFTRNVCGVLLLSCAMATAGVAADTPNLGREVKSSEIAAWDISVGPDGAGLPGGSGTSQQGAAVYAEKCAACHGDKGEGGPNDALVGGVQTVGSFWPYATTLFDYVRRAMPLYQPQSLSNDEVYALAAYLLNLNGVTGEKEVMNANSLPKVKMPNREKFFVVYPARMQ